MHGPNCQRCDETMYQVVAGLIGTEGLFDDDDIGGDWFCPNCDWGKGGGGYIDMSGLLS